MDQDEGEDILESSVAPVSPSVFAAFSDLTHESFYLVRGVWYPYALQRELRECDEKLTVLSYEFGCFPVALTFQGGCEYGEFSEG